MKTTYIALNIKKTTTFFILLLMSLGFNIALKAQQPLNHQFYEAYISSNFEKWQVAMHQLNQQNTAQKNALIYDYTVAQYGFLGFCVNLKKSKEAEKVIDSAIENADKLINSSQHTATGYALKSAFYGFKIVFSPLKSVYYGPKSLAMLDKAMATNPNHFHCLIEKGNFLFNAPVVAGGNKTESVRYFEMAVKTMEHQPKLIIKNWLYLNTMVLLANAYVQQGDNAKADATFQKILKVEPNFQWVKNTVYPEFKRKLLQNK